MDLKRLNAFRAVAKHGSLRAAANQANQTIPATSIQIRKLEDELGVSLFQRLPNKLVLTDRGKIYLREVNAIFEALDRAAALVAQPEDGLRGNLSISLGADLMKVYAPRVAGFVKEHSGINLNVQVSASGRGMSKVVDGEVDIAFGFYSSVPRGVRRIKVHESGIQLICPPGHPLLNRNVTLGEIARYKIITLPRHSMTRRQLWAAFSSRNISVRNLIEVGGCQTAMTLVRLGLGVALVHSICAGVESQEDIVPVDVTPLFGAIDVGAAVKPETLANPVHKAFMEAFMKGSEPD